MSKTIVAALTAAALIAVALPATADHQLGCTSVETVDICHGHHSSGDGACDYDFETESLSVRVNDVPAAVSVVTQEQCNTWGGGNWSCDTWVLHVGAEQGDMWNPGDTGYTYASALVMDRRCLSGDDCAVVLYLHDTNTGNTERIAIHEGECFTERL